MKPKTMILMVVAVVCGLGASYLTSRLLAERDDQPANAQAPEAPKVKVLVAKKYLSMGDHLKNPAELFVVKEFPKGSVPEEVILDLQALKAKFLRRPINRGTWVTAEELSDQAMTLEVPPGHRATGLRVTLDGSASGFASLPGSRVDILWNRKGSGDGDTFSTVILQNVLVLAADTTDAPIGTKALPASVVTLALVPEDVRRVSIASENGSLRLVLRRPDDNTIEKDVTSRLSDITRKNDPVQAKDRDPEEKGPPGIEEVPPPPVEPKWEPLPYPREENRRPHYVYFQQGSRQWKETIWLDDQGNVIDDDVQRVDPAAEFAPPSPQPAPPALPGAPGSAKRQ
jgi:pilus assembly protein CpaB